MTKSTKQKLRPSSFLKHLFPRTESPNSQCESTGSAKAGYGSSRGEPTSDIAAVDAAATKGPFMVPDCFSYNNGCDEELIPPSTIGTPKKMRRRQNETLYSVQKENEVSNSPFKMLSRQSQDEHKKQSPTSVFGWVTNSPSSSSLKDEHPLKQQKSSSISEELSKFHDWAGTPRAPFAWPTSIVTSSSLMGHVSNSDTGTFDEEFFLPDESDSHSPSSSEWWYSPSSSKPSLEGGFDEEFFSFRSTQETRVDDNSSGNDLDPPNIQRVTNNNNTTKTEKDDDIKDSELFPLSSWEGVIADDVFLHYDVETHSDLWSNSPHYSNSFHTAAEPDAESTDVNTEDGVNGEDDETVVVSNKREVPSPIRRDISHDSRASNNIIGLAKGTQTNYETMKNIFNVTLSAPISLPKEKKKFTFKGLIRSRSTRDGVGTNAGVGSTNIAVALSATPIGYGLDNREKKSPSWRKLTKVNEKAVLRDAQENILTGTPMGGPEKRPPFVMQRTLSLTDKRDKARSRLHPAEKLEHMMSKKVHRRNPSEQMSKIRAIMKRDTDLLSCAKNNGKKWNLVDDAIRGRFDGIDVISCAYAHKNISARHGEKKSRGKRYTPRNIIVDTLWRSSGCNPPEIVFEGYTQRGCGSDRWSAPVHKSNIDPLIPSDLWGQNNITPPTCPSELVELEDGEGNTRLVHSPYRNESSRNILTVQTLDQLKLAHEYAIAPLKNGNIFKSIEIFEKILANLKVKFEACEAKNHVVGSTYHNIALLHMWGGRFEEALTFMNQAIAVRVHTLGHNHASVAVSLARQGMIYFALERFDSALRATNQALAIRKILNDQDHMEVSKLINNVGVIRFLQGEKKNALKDLTKALQMQRKWVEGPLHRGCVLFDTAVTLSNMGKIYIEREKYEMAAYLYEEGLRLQTAVFTRDHAAVLLNLGNVAFSKALAGEKTNAIRIYKSRHNIQSQKFGAQSHEAVETKGLMSVLYIQQSNYVNALRCLEDVLTWQENNLDTNHPALLNTKAAMERLNRLKGM